MIEGLVMRNRSSLISATDAAAGDRSAEDKIAEGRGAVTGDLVWELELT